jgi:hypothetical protein
MQCRLVTTGSSRLSSVLNIYSIWTTATSSLRNLRQPQLKSNRTVVQSGSVSVFFWFNELDLQRLSWEDGVGSILSHRQVEQTCLPSPLKHLEVLLGLGFWDPNPSNYSKRLTQYMLSTPLWAQGFSQCVSLPIAPHPLAKPGHYLTNMSEDKHIPDL